MKLKKLLDKNTSWSKGKNKDFFEGISKGQQPPFLWIGCGDSRVCPNTITGSDLGEIFVNRNVANQVRMDDGNLMASLQYSVEVLKVESIIVCGHFACGGINASFNETNGLSSVDTWIDPIRELIKENIVELDGLGEKDRSNKLVEINVKAQVQNLVNSTTIQNAWENSEGPTIYGVVFDFETGLLKEICQASSC